ncbi:uncharacterized protein LJ206_007522 isoform 1-T1 [Theristicus caerulescens]
MWFRLCPKIALFSDWIAIQYKISFRQWEVNELHVIQAVLKGTESHWSSLQQVPFCTNLYTSSCRNASGSVGSTALGVWKVKQPLKRIHRRLDLAHATPEEDLERPSKEMPCKRWSLAWCGEIFLYQKNSRSQVEEEQKQGEEGRGKRGAT